LKKLFELEIPEIYDGVIEIKGIAREPGERAKVAVYSYDDRIDAVGACVGMKGIRIHSIVRELANENIDVINYSDDIGLYIARALAPAKLKDIYLDKANKVARIVADEDQISLVIGKNGQNIKLASKLTAYEIDVERKNDKPQNIEEALERELSRGAEEAEDEEDIDDAEESDEDETVESTAEETEKAEDSAKDNIADEKPDEEESEEDNDEEDDDDDEEDEEAEKEEAEEEEAEEEEAEKEKKED
jgi:transcription antitermination factor NusA-like protein